MVTTGTTTIGTAPTIGITIVGSTIAGGIVVGALIISTTLVAIYVCTRERKRKASSRREPWLPKSSHRTLTSNLISEHHEPEGS